MKNIEYITNITTHGDRIAGNEVQDREGSLPGQSQKGGRTLVIRRSSLLTGSAWRLGPSERTFLARLSKFLVVGVTGVLVNSLALLFLYQQAHLPLVVASALSTELAIVNNFFWNDHWTFERTGPSLGRFARFNLVSLGGLAITAFTLWVLVHTLGLYYLAANLLGIALATAWSFVANSLWTWGGVQ